MNKAILALLLAGSFSTAVMAADFTGYIMDQKCSTNPAMKGDAACAAKCIKGGSPAVLVTDEGKVYKIDDQAKAAPMAGKQVTISGVATDDTITVSSIK